MVPIEGARAARYSQGISGVAGSIFSDESSWNSDFFSLNQRKFVYEKNGGVQENGGVQDIENLSESAEPYNESLVDNVKESALCCDGEKPENLVKNHKINFFKTIVRCLPQGMPFLVTAIKSEIKAIKSIVTRGFLIFKYELQSWRDLYRGRRTSMFSILGHCFIGLILPFVILGKISFFMLTTVLRITFFTFKLAEIIVTQICYSALGLVKLISTSANIVKHNLDNTVKNNRYTIVRFFVKSPSLLLFISLKVVAYSMKLPIALVLLLFKIGHLLYSGLMPQQPLDSAVLDNKIKKMAKIALITPIICAVAAGSIFIGVSGVGLIGAISILSPWLLTIIITLAVFAGVALLLAGVYVLRRDKHANDECDELLNGGSGTEVLVDPGVFIKVVARINNLFVFRDRMDIVADDEENRAGGLLGQDSARS